MDASDTSYKKEPLAGSKYSSPSDVEKPSPHLPTGYNDLEHTGCVVDTQ
jgi:hypothetical protein